MAAKFWESTQNWVNDVRDFTDLTSRRFSDQTDGLRDKGGQYISFKHVPTGTEVIFKAFLKNFSDSFTPNWTASPGYGRMDDVQTYEGTKRSIRISFSVPAASEEEAQFNLQNVSIFAQMMYPVFDNTGMGAMTIKSAPFIKMKFMNWAANANRDGLLGTLSGFDFSPDLDAGVFQTASEPGKGGNPGKFTIYPKSFTISTTLKVIHETPLGWNKSLVSQKKSFQKFNVHTKKVEEVFNFEPQTPTFPYGETTPGKTFNAQSEEQIKRGAMNPEASKANQTKIEGSSVLGSEGNIDGTQLNYVSPFVGRNPHNRGVMRTGTGATKIGHAGGGGFGGNVG